MTGDAGWVQFLDIEDRSEMEAELAAASDDERAGILDDWRTTAIALSDPRRREVLLEEAVDAGQAQYRSALDMLRDL